MKTKLATSILAVVLAYADANRAKNDAEQVLKDNRENVLDALAKNGMTITVEHADGATSTVKLTEQTRTTGITALEASKVEGIGTAMILKMCSVDQAKAKAMRDAGVITPAQFEALTTVATNPMIRVQTKP
jgi:predicted ThiF/HesA family dinucleotide-utilizing enzyme